MSFRFSSVQRGALVCAAVVPFALLSGCANMVSNSPAGPSFEFGAMKGQIYGGNQPISGATVKLYAAGTTGYGKGSTLLATTTTSTDGNGSFTFTQVVTPPGTAATPSYACPNSKSLLYIVSSGGDPLNNNATNNNTAAVMMAALGQCGSASGLFVVVNEVSTAASVFALAQYINPGTSSPASLTIGTNGDYTLATPPQAGTGLINAFNTVANLETLSTGLATTSLTLTGTASTVSGVATTVTPETAKINHIADILAACVNNATAAAANCTTLFTNAVPPSPAVTSQPTATFATAVDTLQAAYYMATNPVDTNSTNLANLYGLAAAAGAPFQPTLAAQPTDWTVGINYKSTSSCTGTGAAGTFILYPYMLAADASGNIWVLSNNSTTGNLSEVGPTGLPLACVLGGTVKSGEGLAIDARGNVWAAGHTGGGIQKYDPVGGTATAWTEAGITPWAIAADGSGNIFYTTSTSTVREFASAAAAGTAAAATAIGGTTGATPNFMAIDQGGRIWVPETSTAGGLYEFYPDTGGSAVGGFSSVGIDSSGTPVYTYNNQGMIAIDNAGKIWLGESNSRNIMSTITPGTSSGSAASTVTDVLTAAFAGGTNSPRGVAVDGAGNVWAPNGVAQGVAPALQAVVEFDKNGNALSPSAGTSTATTNGGYQKVSTVFPSTLRGVTVDPSGNVWMGTNSTTGTSISEVVGAAVPVVTPLALQLANGTIATKP